MSNVRDAQPARPAIHLPTANPHSLHPSTQHLTAPPARPPPGPRTPAHSHATRASARAAQAHASSPPCEAAAQHNTQSLPQTRQACQLSYSPPAPTILPHKHAPNHPQAPLPSPSIPHERLSPPTHTTAAPQPSEPLHKKTPAAAAHHNTHPQPTTGSRIGRSREPVKPKRDLARQSSRATSPSGVHRKDPQPATLRPASHQDDMQAKKKQTEIAKE